MGKGSFTSLLCTTISITFPVMTNQSHDKIEMVVNQDKDGSLKNRYLKRVKDK